MTEGTTMSEFTTRFDVAALAESMAAEVRRDPEAWENSSLSSFLSGLSGWLEDMDGYYQARDQSVPKQPTWQLIADLLRAATVYE